jgi:Terpene synthase family 2, C-terminal metal binding
MTHDTLRAIKASLARIRGEYSDLIAKPSAGISLQEMLDHDQFHLPDYCRDYLPNPNGAAMHQVAEKFGRRYGIWLDSAQHYISCPDYLYPSASFVRLVTLGKNFAVDYYLNNTIGRDKVGLLTPEQREVAEEIRLRIATINADLHLCPNAHPIEQANVEMLADIRKESPTDWFTEFLRQWRYHIDMAHTDRNASALGYIPSIEELIDNRSPISGMPHSIQIIEFCDNQFLPWSRLTAVGLAHPLRRLHRLVASVGGLMNDLFSFENEFIDSGADSNLIVVVALNEPSLSLSEAIVRAATIVRNFIAESLTLFVEIRNQGRALQGSNPEIANTLESHLCSLERCLQACWTWQIYTMRYKRVASIWRETRLDRHQ